MDTIKDFFNRLFFEMTHDDSIFIISVLVISFLIGLLFGWWQGRRGKKKLKKALKQKESELITLQAAHKEIQEQLELKEADLTKANLELEELRTQTSAIEQEKVELRTQLYDANSELENLKAENLTNLSQIEALNSKILSYQEGNTDTTSDNVAGVNLAEVQTNYDNAHIRLAAIEDKLSRIERENSTLKSELASMKDTSLIAFVDEEQSEDDEELVLENVSIADDTADSHDPEAKSNLAKQQLKAAFGNRILAATADEKDDLKKINGIGPFIEEKLNDIGIYTFKQIGQFDEEIIQQITDAIQFFPGRIKRDDWVGQAKELS